jgi:hypothetical protein
MGLPSAVPEQNCPVTVWNPWKSQNNKSLFFRSCLLLLANKILFAKATNFKITNINCQQLCPEVARLIFLAGTEVAMLDAVIVCSIPLLLFTSL